MLDFDPSQVAIPAAHFIGGRRIVKGSDALAVRRPSDGAVLAEMRIADATVVDEAAADAKHAFQSSGWARRPPRERGALLHRWADLIAQNRLELARLEAVGSTRPISDAYSWDVPYLADTIRFFAEYADKLGGDVAATRSDNLGMIVAEPYGVVGAIVPWNFPLTQTGWKVGAALAAGNAVVVKPSEMTPFSVVRMAELAVEAGVPPGIFNVVQGAGTVTGEALVRHPDIAKITFTGSTRTGAAIMAASADAGVKPVTLELGGKSPQLVFADVPDLDKVAATVARSILYNGGQVCVAGSRLVVERSIADALLERIIAIAAAVKPGPTWSSATTFAPIISEPQAQRIDGIVQRTVASGAQIVTGGRRLPATAGGAFYAPTLLANLTCDMEAVREEIFGPVLTVQTFADEEEAFALADHPRYGLASGVFTADLNRAMRAMRRIEAGTVWINRYGRSNDMNLPTGGFKRSGVGKDLGRHAVEANLRHKTVLIDFS
ncbi:MAG: aldehyde dehydrogenase family protein [Roseiarcus sp.]